MPPITVAQLIGHLRTLPQDLPVYRMVFEDGYIPYPLLPEDVKKGTLEIPETGKEFDCVLIGDEV